MGSLLPPFVRRFQTHSKCGGVSFSERELLQQANEKFSQEIGIVELERFTTQQLELSQKTQVLATIAKVNSICPDLSCKHQ